MARRGNTSASVRLVIASLLVLIVTNFHGSQSLTFSLAKRIQEVASDEGISSIQYLEKVSNNAKAYRKSSEVAGRFAFMYDMQKAMGETGLRLVIGGKSLGKTKMMKKLVADAGDSPLLYINMRLPPKAKSTDALECLQAEARRKWSMKNFPPGLEKGLALLKNIFQAAGKQSFKSRDGDDAVDGGIELVVAELLNMPKPQEFVEAWVSATVAADKIPTIIIDEANMAFPNGNGNGQNRNAKREAAYQALAALVALTKEESKACVFLVASDYTFPFHLQKLGFNKYDAIQTIVAPEVEEEPMIALLMRWGLPEDIAKEFFSNFGGNVFLCENVVDNLRSKFRMGEESLFDPFNVRGNEGLIGLVKDPLTRQHMVNMAQQGWSAIEEASAEEKTPSQQAARIIAKKNFGAVIGRETTTFFDPSLKEEMFKDSNVLQVLVPPTTYAGNCIQRMVDATKSSSSTPQLSSAVWVRQLRQEDDGEIKEADTDAFPVKGELENVAELKNAIKKEEELSIAASKLEVRSLKDGRWEKETEMSKSLRDTDESDCYGYLLPN